ncbi:MAG TPA: hypothetical protein VJY35_04890, partial [Candidatus Eisenbacteria bacterium]|nr:hypothetical protein [Candidatus Eisenbacteria bacterium]
MQVTTRRPAGAAAPGRRSGPGGATVATMVAAVVVLSTLATGRAAAQSENVDLRRLLAAAPAESLPMLLRRFEADHARSGGATEAAMAIGHFHYARGEYRLA